MTDPNRLPIPYAPGVTSVIVPQRPTVVSLNPTNFQPNGTTPLLQALSGPGQVFEVWAVDLRDQTTNPSPIWLQIFDSFPAPVSGVTQPTVGALPVCTVASYVWEVDQYLIESGLWVALSSTPLVYTEIVSDLLLYSITARVLP